MNSKAWESTIGRRSRGKAKKRRATSIFTTMSVAHVDDDEEEAEEEEEEGTVIQAEKFLSNGDFYTGDWSDNLPHGHGKYLWIDGCMYVGEWNKGKTTGKGKFSWPTGSTYEGEFKNGYMDGAGTYTGSNGDTYKGSWVMNMMHGQGTKRYVNGDYYEGEWRQGLQEGQGRYQWKNGNHYTGQFKEGKMNGNGTLVWGNGNRYGGFWEDGFPKGSGSYRFSEGGFYVGIWSKDLDEQNGTFYPVPDGSNTENGDLNWSPEMVYEVELSDCVVCPGEEILIYPSEKVVNWDDGDLMKNESIWKPSNEVKPRRRSVDGGLINGGRYNAWVDVNDGGRISVPGNISEAFASLQLDESVIGRQFHSIVLPKQIKRPGVTISIGHKNYDLMLNLQLGIRHSVGRPGPVTNFDLKASAFDPKEKVWTKFPPEGSKYTPPHSSCDFRWKDYCPLVFRTLRKLFKVDAAEYMLSICGDDALRELSSPGKSGSFFYLTHDDKYMIKTMKKAEVKVLLRMLPAYYNHFRTFDNTLVTKFYGLHCVKLTGSAQKKVRFVIMGNLFCTNYTIHRRFDLKGSSHGRTTDKPEAEIDPNTTLKDLDLNYIFRLQKFWFQEFCRQVDRDCDFLEQERIMDYSLLVGLHFQESSSSGNGVDEKVVVTPRLSRVDKSDSILLDAAQLQSTQLGISMPAKAERTVRNPDGEAQLIGEATGQCYDVVLFYGIIDILQDYDISKKLEHAYKSFQYDSTSISAVDPKQYSRRFRDFIFKVFAEDS
ncbi:hypothetical protein V2J09_012100 [Rumex salicifolius]